MFLIGGKDPIWRGTLFGSALAGGGSPAPQPVVPSNTVAPEVSGTPQVGQTINTSSGTWSGTAPITYEYRWQSSADGSTGWADIASATASTFTLQGAQQGLYLRARVRGTNAAGQSGWAASASTGQIAAPPVLAAPTRQTAPTVAGTFQVGQTLTIGQPAVYSGNPAPTISYRWQMRPNGGGTITTLNTGASLTLTESHVGMQIRLQDMASNSQGSTALAGGTWLGPVAAAPTGPTQQAARAGATGRGATDFVGPYDYAPGGGP